MLLASIVGLVVHLDRSRAAADAALHAAISSCFERLAATRSLEFVPVDPMVHPVVGLIPMNPRLRGEIGGFAIAIAVEGDPTHEGDEHTVVRLRAPTGSSDWSSDHSLVGEARIAFDALRHASRRITLHPKELIAEPKVEAKTDWHGRTRRIVTDPSALDAFLELALGFARATDERESQSVRSVS